MDQQGRYQQRKTPKRNESVICLSHLLHLVRGTNKHVQVQKVQRLQMEAAHGLEGKKVCFKPDN